MICFHPYHRPNYIDLFQLLLKVENWYFCQNLGPWELTRTEINCFQPIQSNLDLNVILPNGPWFKEFLSENSSVWNVPKLFIESRTYRLVSYISHMDLKRSQKMDIITQKEREKNFQNVFNNSFSFILKNIRLFPISIYWRRFSIMLAVFHIFRPITNILGWIEDEISWTRHMMFPLSFAHIVVCTICFIGMIADVTLFFIACHFIRWK